MAAQLIEAGGETVVVQGYAVMDPSALAELNLPPGESAVEIPRSLVLAAAAQILEAPAR